MENEPNIIIAECNSISRLGLKILCQQTLPNPTIHEVTTLSDLYKTLKTSKFDLLILDLFLDHNNILSALPELLSFQPALNILVTSQASENIYCNRVLKEGAKGYINKTEESQHFELAIKRVCYGNYYISQDHYIQSLNQIEKRSNIKNPFESLSNKEIEIVFYMLEGMSTTEISEKTRLAVSTISTYKMRIFTKLDIHNLMSLIELATSYEIHKSQFQ